MKRGTNWCERVMVVLSPCSPFRNPVEQVEQSSWGSGAEGWRGRSGPSSPPALVHRRDFNFINGHRRLKVLVGDLDRSTEERRSPPWFWSWRKLIWSGGEKEPRWEKKSAGFKFYTSKATYAHKLLTPELQGQSHTSRLNIKPVRITTRDVCWRA